jgi:hypothetical protein
MIADIVGGVLGEGTGEAVAIGPGVGDWVGEGVGVGEAKIAAPPRKREAAERSETARNIRGRR